MLQPRDGGSREGWLELIVLALRRSFPHHAVSVEVNGDNVALCIEFHLDIVCRLQWVVLALSADQNSSSYHSVVLVFFECKLELARFEQRALEHCVVDQTCITVTAHAYTPTLSLRLTTSLIYLTYYPFSSRDMVECYYYYFITRIVFKVTY